MSTRTSTRRILGGRRPGAGPATLLLAAALLLGLATLAAAPATATAVSSGVDDWVHTWEVVRLAAYQQSRPEPPGGVSVYYLGDSIGRESTISDASWTRLLKRKAAAAGRIPVSSARGVAGHNQTFGMDETIVRGLPPTPERQPRGIVLIGVGISRFIGPPAPMDPAALEPPPPGQEPPLSPWVQHRYDGRAPLSLARKRELVPRWMERRWDGFVANKRDNVREIQRLVDLCKGKGLRPILLDLPLDLRIAGPGLARPRTAIRTAMDSLAERNRIRYLHFNGSLDLPSSSFWDLHHLLRPGYERWQARLSAELVKALPRAR